MAYDIMKEMKEGKKVVILGDIPIGVSITRILAEHNLKESDVIVLPSEPGHEFLIPPVISKEEELQQLIIPDLKPQDKPMEMKDQAMGALAMLSMGEALMNAGGRPSRRGSNSTGSTLSKSQQQQRKAKNKAAKKARKQNRR